MSEYRTNQERTAEYLKKFDREKCLKSLIKESAPVIFDVGANVGSSVQEFKHWWPEAKVHCFEPQKECWCQLQQAAAASKYGEDDIVINKLAAGNVSVNQATFYTHEISTGISGFHKINLKSRDSVDLRRVLSSNQGTLEEYEKSLNHERRVNIVRLDAYMEQNGIPHVNLMKIDTQGYEPEVLDGMGERLSDVDVIITELMFYDYYERNLSFSDIEQFLLPAGFRLYDISHISKNPMNGRTDWVDVIYVNDRVRTGEKSA